MDTLHLITVNETAESLLRATGAMLTVSISGQSFFAGKEAFKKATEVRSFVEALKEAGISDDAISIKNVRMSVESGLLSKSSSATYDLAIQCTSLDRLGPVIAAIASQKNAAMNELRWQYGDLQTTQNELLQKAVRQARATAQSIADALGTRCTTVHKLSYEFHGANQHLQTLMKSPRRAKMAFDEQDLDLANELTFEHSTNLRAAVAAQFVVQPFHDATN